MKFQRNIVAILLSRISEPVRFIQIVLGPRQVGKTTAVVQLTKSAAGMPALYASTDDVLDADFSWLHTQWERARRMCSENKTALLVLDELQKITDWQKIVKGLWDEDRRKKRELHVILTGSSSLLLKKGVGESLAGRFEQLLLRQWSFSEMKQCFDFTLEDYLLFGGYPGAAILITDKQRWRDYIRTSIVEAAISKDILSLQNITKPALLKQLFITVARYPAQVVSYNKLLGQLADAGNVTTLKNYAELCADAFLLNPLEKWRGSAISSRASSPKWLLLDNALFTCFSDISPVAFHEHPDYGRLVENAVGAHLCRLGVDPHYWRDDKNEVDFVVKEQGKLFAIEVKAGSRIRSRSGLSKFCAKHKNSHPLIIGSGGIPIDEFLCWDKWDV